jgi:hypothetical protein
LAWADFIKCTGSGDCIGAEKDDCVIGDDNGQPIYDGGSNDKIIGKGGPDGIVGFLGNDDIDGGSGSDGITGAPRADKMVGGGGDDAIVHRFNQPERTLPDRSKDVIDCCVGNDVAWINVSVDHDIAVNYELLHTG